VILRSSVALTPHEPTGARRFPHPCSVTAGAAGVRVPLCVGTVHPCRRPGCGSPCETSSRRSSGWSTCPPPSRWGVAPVGDRVRGERTRGRARAWLVDVGCRVASRWCASTSLRPSRTSAATW